MARSISSKSIIWFISLVTLIFASNTVLYRIPAIGPLPGNIALATFIDFLIIIPVLAYFFIIRKRYSLKYIGLAVLAGYGAAYWVIPSPYFEQFSFITYVVVFSEALFIALELYLLFKIIQKVPTIWKNIRHVHRNSSYFNLEMRNVLTSQFPKNKMANIILTDLSLFYYSLFSWRKKPNTNDGQMFTYHHKTSAIAVYIMLIHAVVIETAGLHFLLHNLSPVVSYIVLVLNIYGVLYFLADLQFIRLTPFLLKKSSLHLYTGIAKGISIPLDKIESFHMYEGPVKLSREEQKHTFIATVQDLNMEPTKPQFEIILTEPLNMNLMYGMKKKVIRVLLNVDEARMFKENLELALQDRTIQQ